MTSNNLRKTTTIDVCDQSTLDMRRFQRMFEGALVLQGNVLDVQTPPDKYGNGKTIPPEQRLTTGNYDLVSVTTRITCNDPLTFDTLYMFEKRRIEHSY